MVCVLLNNAVFVGSIEGMEPIRIPHISFTSDLASTIIELERIRTTLQGQDQTDLPLYSDLQKLFQNLSNIMSARIEGNRTTMLDALQGVRDGQSFDDGVREILNLEKASAYIDDVVTEDFVLTEMFIRELHALAVDGLEREGDATPGSYRSSEVRIAQSTHQPPGPESVPADMRQLVEFMNKPMSPQYHLLQVAISHHRFVWIHPFGNGNGRVSRLITYAMLVKLGFTATHGYRALNPTVVFGSDRHAYYRHLETADSLRDDDLESWCLYVLRGIESDVKNILELSSTGFVLNELYGSVLEKAYQNAVLTSRDVAVLLRIAEMGRAHAKDVEDLVPGSAAVRSKYLKKLVDRDLLYRPEGTRQYSVRVQGNDLTIYVVRQLDELGMLPQILRDGM